MKKRLFIIILTIFFAILPTSAAQTYKVIKIIDGDTIYVDFNNNNIADENEKIRLKGIDTFEITDGQHLRNQMNYYNLRQKEVFGLGYLAKEFIKTKLLNQPVETRIIDKDCFNRNLAYVQINNQDIGKLLLSNGLAVVYSLDKNHEKYNEYLKDENINKVIKNAHKAGRLKLYIYNKEQNIYHQPICQYAKICKTNCELIEKKYIPKNAKKCHFFKYYTFLSKDNYHIERSPSIKSKNIEIYFIDSIKYRRPSDKSRTAAAQSLLKEINNAHEIDFAIYGISSQPEIFNALLRAKAQGKIVRGITDMDERNTNIYSDTKYLIYQLQNITTDYFFSTNYKNFKNFDIQGSIMHNKFFIFDKQKVWTGSTNISSTGIGGYNTNISILINSKEIANLYMQEFNQMYNKKFHEQKSIIQNTKNIIVGNSLISIYFSPKQNAFNEEIIPLINEAKHYIYVPIFFLTNWDVGKALVNAQNRGVDVKIILDGIAANNPYSMHHYLRKNGIAVKVENFGGKMHAKTAIIDDMYTIIASMNWTKVGANSNDENTVIIKNKKIAKKTKQFFIKQWNWIPEKFLKTDPQSEGKDSLYSCFDGLDNDHNGFIDFDDVKCQYDYNIN